MGDSDTVGAALAGAKTQDEEKLIVQRKHVEPALENDPQLAADMLGKTDAARKGM